MFFLCILQFIIYMTEHKSEYIKFLTKHSNGVEQPLIEFPQNIIKQYIIIFKNKYYYKY